MPGAPVMVSDGTIVGIVVAEQGGQLAVVRLTGRDLVALEYSEGSEGITGTQPL